MGRVKWGFHRTCGLCRKRMAALAGGRALEAWSPTTAVGRRESLRLGLGTLSPTLPTASPSFSLLLDICTFLALMQPGNNETSSR